MSDKKEQDVIDLPYYEFVDPDDSSDELLLDEEKDLRIEWQKYLRILIGFILFPSVLTITSVIVRRLEEEVSAFSSDEKNLKESLTFFELVITRLAYMLDTLTAFAFVGSGMFTVFNEVIKLDDGNFMISIAMFSLLCRYLVGPASTFSMVKIAEYFEEESPQ